MRDDEVCECSILCLRHPNKFHSSSSRVKAHLNPSQVRGRKKFNPFVS